MRRRFGRKRGGDGRSPIDAGSVLARIAEAGLVPAGELSPLELEGIPASFAAVGRAEADGSAFVVAFSPRSGANAVLAALAAGVEQLGEGGTAYAVAPVWGPADRRVLALAAPRSFSLESREAPALGDGLSAEAEPQTETLVLPAARVAQGIADLAERALFERAAAGLAGLAAKHGGSVRGAGSSVDLVLYARRVASLRPDGTLETLLPRRASDRLAADGLADALDRLEGNLRKHLNDRKVRDGEEGLRARSIDEAATAAGLRSLVRWPLPGSDPEVLDFVGVDAEGRPVTGAIRRRVDIESLAAVLEAVLGLRTALPALLAGVTAPVKIDTPKLLLIADAFDDAALRALGELSLAIDRLPLGAEQAETVSEGRRERSRRGRGRRRGGRRGGGGASDAEGEIAESTSEEAAEPEGPRFAELSAFDLTDDDSGDRPRRGRRRGRGRRGGREGAAEAGAAEDDDEAEPEAQGRGRRRRRRRAQGADAGAGDDQGPIPFEEAERLGDVEDEPPLESEEEVAARVLEDAEAAADAEADAEADAVEEPSVDVPEVEEPPKVERPRRAVILAHADRGSVAASLLLAREVRSLEGLYVYPQEDLMTFFRSVVTDLREDVFIYVVGFVARPAIEVLQTATLYRGRLAWFDHHEWPPEDLGALKSTLGEEWVQVEAGLDSPLPMVVAECTRRSRFSDKVVDLAAARFSEHDFTRWGRLWWWRIGEMAASRGDRRGDVDGILAGRPSDLAREAARVDTPPPPPEVAWVGDRDFVLQHFGGYTMVLVPVPGELDLHLAGRIARERHAAELSLAWWEGGDLAVLAGEDKLDLQAMAVHLASKHEWIDALPTGDHVARFRVRGLESHLEDVVAEIAMGRSVLEG